MIVRFVRWINLKIFMQKFITDLKDIQGAIIDFNNSPLTQELKQQYYSKSLAEIYGVNRKEDVHSNFLAWMFNPTESHGLEDFNIKRLIDILLQVGGDKFKTTIGDVYNSIVVGNYQIDNVSVFREKYTKTGRPDIEINFTLKANEEKEVTIVLENKVGSLETMKDKVGQTTRYYDTYKKDSKTTIFIYLTPLSSIELDNLLEPECSCKEFIQINYQLIHDYILHPALSQNSNQKTKFIIKEYIRTLTQPALRNENEYNPKIRIMALGKEEKELLLKFWDQNEGLIKSALFAFRQVDNLGEEIYKALETIENTDTRDRSKYTFNGIERLGKSALVLAVVKYVIERDKINTWDSLNKTFPKSIAPDITIFARWEDVVEDQRRRGTWAIYHVKDEDKITIGGENYAVARNWTKIENIDRFIQHCEDVLGIKITKTN